MPGRKKATTKKATKKTTRRASAKKTDAAKTLELIQKRLREEAELALGKSAKTKDYDMKAAFEVGDRIEHNSFGLGIVRTLVGESKIGVVFQDKERTLIHQRSAA